MDEIHRKIMSFFDDFNDAFATFDGRRVASKFSFPFLARNSEGTSTVFSNEAELSQYFQKYLNAYRQQGCVVCRYADLRVVMLGQETAVASVCWSLLDAAGATVTSWHESYMLSIGAEVPTAFASIDQV